MMATLMRVGLEMRRIAEAYQKEFRKQTGIELPLTIITQFIGQHKVGLPNERDMRLLKLKFAKRRM